MSVTSIEWSNEPHMEMVFGKSHNGFFCIWGKIQQIKTRIQCARAVSSHLKFYMNVPSICVCLNLQITFLHDSKSTTHFVLLSASNNDDVQESIIIQQYAKKVNHKTFNYRSVLFKFQASTKPITCKYFDALKEVHLLQASITISVLNVCLKESEILSRQSFSFFLCQNVHIQYKVTTHHLYWIQFIITE